MNIRSFTLVSVLLIPGAASAESGMGGLWILGVPVIIAIVFGIPILFLWLIWRSIRNGKKEGHEEYKHKEANRPPIGRMGE